MHQQKGRVHKIITDFDFGAIIRRKPESKKFINRQSRDRIRKAFPIAFVAYVLLNEDFYRVIKDQFDVDREEIIGKGLTLVEGDETLGPMYDFMANLFQDDGEESLPHINQSYEATLQVYYPSASQNPTTTAA